MQNRSSQPLPYEAAVTQHGGNLSAAIDTFGGVAADWLDLSTGINPVPYPIGDVPKADWTALPDSGALGELIAAARRLGLEQKIAEQLEQRSYQDRGDASTQSSAAVAGEHLNAFTIDAGAAFIPSGERPDIQMPDGSKRKPFEPRRQADGVENLPEAPRAAMVDYLTDWLHVLHRVFEENAMDTSNGQVDPEQNLKLGSILKSLETV